MVDPLIAQLYAVARSSGLVDVEIDTTDDAFAQIGKVHDWRNYIPHEVRALWSQLTERERLLCIAIAGGPAGNEDWD